MIRKGKGIGCMWYPIGFTVAANPSAATVKVNEDGTFLVQPYSEPIKVLPSQIIKRKPDLTRRE